MFVAINEAVEPPVAQVYFYKDETTGYVEHIVARTALSLTGATIEMTGLSDDDVETSDVMAATVEDVGSFPQLYDPDTFDPTNTDAEIKAKPFECSLPDLALLGGLLLYFHTETREAVNAISPSLADAAVRSVSRRISGRMAGRMAAVIEKHVALRIVDESQAAGPLGFSNIQWFSAQ